MPGTFSTLSNVSLVDCTRNNVTSLAPILKMYPSSEVGVVVRRTSRGSCSAMLTLNMTVLSTSTLGPLSFEGLKLIMSHCRSANLNRDDNAVAISIQLFLYCKYLNLSLEDLLPNNGGELLTFHALVVVNLDLLKSTGLVNHKLKPRCSARCKRYLLHDCVTRVSCESFLKEIQLINIPVKLQRSCSSFLKLAPRVINTYFLLITLVTN